MRPNTNKPKTAKAGRRFRGLEVAQAALLLVLGVVVAMAMYFIVTGMMMTVPAYYVQLDPYSSYIYDNKFHVVLKFGKSVTVYGMDIANSADMSVVGYNCGSPTGSWPWRAQAGHIYHIECLLNPNVKVTHDLIIRMGLDDEGIYLRWVLP
jgi:hypothetical protein